MASQNLSETVRAIVRANESAHTRYRPKTSTAIHIVL